MVSRCKLIPVLSIWILESIDSKVLFSFKHDLPSFISSMSRQSNEHHNRLSASCIYRNRMRHRFGRCQYRMSEKSQEVDEILGRIYDWSGYSKIGGDGYCTSPDEDSNIEAASGPLAFEYGEITLKGMRTLASVVGLKTSDAFFDLGSGVSPFLVIACDQYTLTILTCRHSGR